MLHVGTSIEGRRLPPFSAGTAVRPLGRHDVPRLRWAAAKIGRLHSSASPPASQLPSPLRARRLVVLVPLGVGQNSGTFDLPLEPPQGAIQAFILANTNLCHPPPPPRHSGPALTARDTSDPPAGMNETSVIILRRAVTFKEMTLTPLTLHPFPSMEREIWLGTSVLSPIPEAIPSFGPQGDGSGDGPPPDRRRGRCWSGA